jgi:hypothetical protein
MRWQPRCECPVNKDLEAADRGWVLQTGCNSLFEGPSLCQLLAVVCSNCACLCLLQSDVQIGSPMVCRGGVLAGLASYHNPGPVYTPIGDYVSWIQTNQKIRDYADGAWK